MFQKTTLKNGLRIITVPMQSTQAVTILVLVGTGSKYETKETNGISHFLEHMFFKGTKKRPTWLEVNEAIDKVGGVQNAFTSNDCTGFHVTLASKHLDLGLDWISDVFLNSKFEEKEIAKEKGVIVEEINYLLDTPTIYIYDLWPKILYGDQPAGWSIAGTKENILRFRRKNFLDYLNNHYCAQSTIICMAGKIDEKIVKEKIRKYFQNIRKFRPKIRQPVIEKQKTPKVLLQTKKTDQTHLALGVRAYNNFHPKKYALAVLEKILGGMMSSRLLIEIRQKQGLAYYIYSYVDSNPDTGSLACFAGVDNKNIEKAIKIILREYKKLTREKVSEKELATAKENIKGKMILNLESSAVQASFYAEQELLEQKILTPEQIFKKIDAVTSNDIIKVAQDIFRPEKLNLALIGPFKEKAKFQSLLEL